MANERNQSIRRKLLMGSAAASLGGAALTVSSPAAAGTLSVGNVKDFGATGNGNTNDTLAIQNAFASSNAVIYFPAGEYLLTQPSGGGALLSRSQAGLVIIGDGSGLSQIIWAPPSSDTGTLIQWSTNQASDVLYDHFEVRDISIVAQDVALGTAISAVKTALGSPTRVRQTAVIENVEISIIGGGYFTNGVYLQGMENAKIRTITVEGTPITSAGVRVPGVGIEINSQAVPKVTDAHVHHVSVYNFDVGLRLSGYEEGLMLTDSLISGCRIGVTTPLADILPGLYIRGCHINASYMAIDIQNMVAAIITDNNILNIGASSEHYHIGINTGALSSAIAKNIQIRGNLIANDVGTATQQQGGITGSVGIVVPNSPADDFILITDNHITQYQVGVWLQTGSNDVFVSHTNRFQGGGVLDQGSGNTVQP